MLRPDANAWALSSPDGDLVIYSMDGADIVLDQPLPEAMSLRWIGGDAATTTMMPAGTTVLRVPSGSAGQPRVALLTTDVEIP